MGGEHIIVRYRFPISGLNTSSRFFFCLLNFGRVIVWLIYFLGLPPFFLVSFSFDYFSKLCYNLYRKKGKERKKDECLNDMRRT